MVVVRCSAGVYRVSVVPLARRRRQPHVGKISNRRGAVVVPGLVSGCVRRAVSRSSRVTLLICEVASPKDCLGP